MTDRAAGSCASFGRSRCGTAESAVKCLGVVAARGKADSRHPPGVDMDLVGTVSISIPGIFPFALTRTEMLESSVLTAKLYRFALVIQSWMVVCLTLLHSLKQRCPPRAIFPRTGGLSASALPHPLRPRVGPDELKALPQRRSPLVDLSQPGLATDEPRVVIVSAPLPSCAFGEPELRFTSQLSRCTSAQNAVRRSLGFDSTLN